MEERQAFYEAELRAANGEVAFEEDPVAGDAWAFSGEWFEYGRLYVTENDGTFDDDRIDTSDLPVLISVQVWERDSD